MYKQTGGYEGDPSAGALYNSDPTHVLYNPDGSHDGPSVYMNLQAEHGGGAEIIFGQAYGASGHLADGSFWAAATQVTVYVENQNDQTVPVEPSTIDVSGAGAPRLRKSTPQETAMILAMISNKRFTGMAPGKKQPFPRYYGFQPTGWHDQPFIQNWIDGYGRSSAQPEATGAAAAPPARIVRRQFP